MVGDRGRRQKKSKIYQKKSLKGVLKIKVLFLPKFVHARVVLPLKTRHGIFIRFSLDFLFPIACF